MHQPARIDTSYLPLYTSYFSIALFAVNFDFGGRTAITIKRSSGDEAEIARLLLRETDNLLHRVGPQIAELTLADLGPVRTIGAEFHPVAAGHPPGAAILPRQVGKTAESMLLLHIHHKVRGALTGFPHGVLPAIEGKRGFLCRKAAVAPAFHRQGTSSSIITRNRFRLRDTRHAQQRKF